ncbi:MAG: DNA-binding XRE family transcriptional regulator [Phenylobacterium sp.]|jgi:DNA-binding XRE family transcriptional regulator
MGRSFKEVIGSLPKEEQDAIQKQSSQLKAEYMALQEIRKAMDMTQKEVASKLHIAQDGVSRLEKRSDLMISTLRKYIEAMGGKLNIVAELPNHPPIYISGFSDKP